MNNLMNLFQQMADSDHPVLKAVGNFLLAAVTAVYAFLGVINESFFRIFAPDTWTMQDIASFCAIPASVMYFMKLHTERKIAKIMLKRALIESEKGNEDAK